MKKVVLLLAIIGMSLGAMSMIDSEPIGELVSIDCSNEVCSECSGTGIWSDLHQRCTIIHNRECTKPDALVETRLLALVVMEESIEIDCSSWDCTYCSAKGEFSTHLQQCTVWHSRDCSKPDQ